MLVVYQAGEQPCQPRVALSPADFLDDGISACRMEARR
ncbi:hypothetical protein BN2537_199 [Streptomyces venezuelae]|nr:hypothetical protein BN2537_199 [Streptomyces venezuelae]